MKIKKSNKLFYKKYKYRLYFRGDNLHHIFSSKRINSKTMRGLDLLVSHVDNFGYAIVNNYHYYGNPKEIRIHKPERDNLAAIVDFLKFIGEYRTIKGYHMFALFFNCDDPSLIHELCDKISDWRIVLEYCDEEVEKFLMKNRDTVVTPTDTGCIAKITLRHGSISDGTAEFLKSQLGKIKENPSLERMIEDRRLEYGRSFYVKDESTVFMMQMSIGNYIQKIESVVYKDDIDKYSHEYNQ